MHKVPPEDRAVHERVHELVSREYKEFQEEESLRHIPLTIYEKACSFAGRIFKIDLDPKSHKRLNEAIEFAHLRITPGQVASLTLLFTFAVCIPTFLLLVLGNIGALIGVPLPGVDINLSMFIFLTTVAVAYYFYMYPSHLRKRYEMAVGSDMVSAILYIVIYMRNIPSLEGAAEFAARNMTGPMAAELRKLMWDVRVGNYLSMEDALLSYAGRWKNNREFAQSIELIVSSLKQTQPRSTTLLDEAIRVILDGNRESAAAYVRNLKMPLTVIHAMGLILPVMGLVLFPIIAIFLAVDAVPLLLLYDILLPLALFFTISRALESRPATYSKIDISLHPNLPPPGKFFMGKKAVKALPIGAAFLIIFILLGIVSYSVGITCPVPSTTLAKATIRCSANQVCCEDETRGLFESSGRAMVSWPVLGALLATIGLAGGPALYYLLLSSRRSKLRDAVRKIENEFQEALFQMGTALGGGAPIETSILDALKRMEGMKIKDMFQRVAVNMQRFSMTFENAFFDKEQGALRFYPSLLIRSIVRAIVEASRKGVRNASNAMLSISQYLRGLHATQLQVEESLSDVTGSLRFQAYALTPLISGVVATMAVLIIRILQELSAKTEELGGAGMAGISPISGENLHISPFQFIIVVSIFLVESLFLLSYLMSGIETGEDSISRGELTGWVLIIGTIAYIASTVLTLSIFTPLATSTI